ncbi:Adenylate kinase [Hondaea fermentalgiana]|uniref:UMP-CMP kinase n=1 Tax=Hondaea fermentalgiana TaxID=2315210 RepID=A0A2R5GV34_9STRA|nr:Adenylate kinase [Hondaea fermentalgiana]|eukprot:GBG31774.1 Adenylate kinase [Hondaea fermentalgiana]
MSHTTVEVQAGAVHEVSLNAQAGEEIHWAFKTEGGDIAFCVLLERPDGNLLTLVAKDRISSEVKAVKGKATTPEAGCIWLQFDNGYSWVTNKTLTFSISHMPASDAKAFASSSSPPADGVQASDAADKDGGPSKVLFVLGAPGSGKGTQCTKLAEAFQYCHLSAGDLLRAERKNPDSKDGALIEAYIKEGKIVPIEITVKLLLSAMAADTAPCYLIDGFPRNQDNLEGWIRETSGRSDIEVLGVLFFDCPEQIITERILERGKSSGRSDDNAVAIKKRLATFRNETMPIVEYFEKREQVWRIDTNRPISDIFTNLCTLLNKILPVSAAPALESGPGGNENGATAAAPAKVASWQAKATSTAVPAPAPAPAPALAPGSPNGVGNGAASAVVLEQSKNAGQPLRVILGSMTMGGPVNRRDSAKMFQMFAEAPAVQKHLTASKVEVDTARMYQSGETEVVISDVFAKQPALADNFMVATKANPFPGAGENLRPESVKAQLEDSLRALRLDSVDVFYLHAPDHSTKIEATLEAVQALYRAGKFRELGLSNFSAWETVQVYYICKERGYVLPTLYQGMYNGITRAVEQELLPALRALGIRFYAYNPLAGGFLTGKHRSLVQFPKDGRFGETAWGIRYRDRFWKPEYFKALDVITAACEENDIAMTSASIRWLMHHSALRGGLNDGIILGASSLGHLETNLAAADEGPLPKAVVAAFNQAWETCQPACPAYAR